MIHGPNSPDKPPADVRAAQSADKDPWVLMYRYENRIAYIMLGFVVVGMVLHAVRLLRRYAPAGGLAMARVRVFPRVVAALRSVGYRQSTTMNRLGFPSVSSLAVVFSFTIATVVWCFTIFPYYRPTREWGSPALAVRAGMFATAIIPFLFSCSLKVNPISLLTGISHSHLQVYHKWLGFLFLFFSLVHTLPFLLQPYWDGGYKNLHAYFVSSPPLYWTGTVALGLAFWMACSSVGFVRNLSYEFFVIQHIAVMMVLMVFLFIHCGTSLNSNLWLWAAVALWWFSVAVRSLVTLFSSDFFANTRCFVEAEAVSSDSGLGEETVVESGTTVDGKESSAAREGVSDLVVPTSMAVRITLVTPLRWRAGQHMYVRFPGICPLQAHPFTAMSLPGESAHLPSRLVLFVGVRKGITERLFQYVQRHVEQQAGTAHSDASSATAVADLEKAGGDTSGNDASRPALPPVNIRAAPVTALLDGPYGCSTGAEAYETTTMFAGGTGISHIYSLVLSVMRRAARGDTRMLTKRVHLVWSVRRSAMLSLIADELQTLHRLRESASVELVIDVYITGESDPRHRDAASEIHLHYGMRPVVRDVVGDDLALAQERSYATALLQVCGGPGLLHDVGNAAARANWALARGRLGSLRDVLLEREHFS
ncbi:hypothetical protein MSPP1_003518 [Malassezia sp. CBS 17886]|nr:hypothetical protein MSPP1_003518 [Malassezia sp. CBS 17886]